MLTIYGRADSSNVQAVMWCIGELGHEHKRLDIGHRFGGTETDEFLEINPNGLVPVLVDSGDPPIFEAAAIIRYLASRYGDDTFWPKDATARAQVDKWAEWVKTTLCPRFTVPIFWRVVRTAPSQQDPTAITAALDAFHDTLTIAEAQLGQQRWLAGANLTPADIQLGHLLFRYYDMDIPRADLPNLRRYYDHLTDRPAYQRHVMVSYEALRVTD